MGSLCPEASVIRLPPLLELDELLELLADEAVLALEELADVELPEETVLIPPVP
jgi:hypothetical protein